MISSVMTVQQRGFDHHSLRNTWLVPDPTALIPGKGDVCPPIPLTAVERAYHIVQEAANTQEHTPSVEEYDPYTSLLTTRMHETP